MDPVARRKIWAALVEIQEISKSSIVLTSHSMDECEALCSRIAIMVNGQFKCLGATQHLRTKYGQGYTVILKVKRNMMDNPDILKQVENFMNSSLPSAVAKDIHETFFHYHVTDTQISLGKLFRILETAKENLNLEDYLVSDTSLEQIFLAFARSQRNEEEDNK